MYNLLIMIDFNLSPWSEDDFFQDWKAFECQEIDFTCE